MSYGALAVAALALGFLVTDVLADRLPPAPTELGSVRRNEQGKLEAVTVPPDSPSASGGATPGSALSKERGLGKAPARLFD